jgi:predicted transcriptional regulator
MIQLDDATAAQLEKVAPGSSRKRSEFLRGVIARALHETLERGTRKAYEKWPDEARAVDPGDWAHEAEAVHPPSKPRRAPRRLRKART